MIVSGSTNSVLAGIITRTHLCPEQFWGEIVHDNFSRYLKNSNDDDDDDDDDDDNDDDNDDDDDDEK